VMRGEKYDGLFATSAGSLVGAMLHGHDVPGLIDLVTKIRSKDVYRLAAPWSIWSRSASLFDTAPLQKLIAAYIDCSAIRLNPTPFRFNVTNLSDGAGEMLEASKLTDVDMRRALLTSASVPALFPLQWQYSAIGDGQAAYCDGGLANDYCVEEAWLSGYDRIVVMAAMVPEPAKVRNVIDALTQTISVAINCQLKKEVDAARKGGAQVILVEPPEPTGIGIIDFDYKRDRKELMQIGYRAAMKALDDAEKPAA